MGEILGLTWECVDFGDWFHPCRKTLCYLPNNGTAIYEFHPPKSKAGKRNIPMSKQVMEILQEQKAWRDKVNSRFKAQSGFENLVFTSKTNHPLHESNIRTAIRYLVNRINTENPAQTFEVFTPHCLRHTFATNCITKGDASQNLCKAVRTQFLQMTMDLYCHALDSTLKDEMSIITEMV